MRIVRNQGGRPAALFRPRVLSICRRERHLRHVWDGRAITTINEKRAFPAEERKSFQPSQIWVM